MRIAYLDAFSGIAGDMTLGALLDLGLPRDILEEGIAKLGLKGIEIRTREAKKNGIRATKVDVLISGEKELPGIPHGTDEAKERRPGENRPHHGTTHSYREIREQITTAGLNEGVTERALAIFQALATAEGKVHGKNSEEVHFHEVGALDAIVDIVGVAIGLEYFAIEKIYASPVPLGSGFVQTQHGRMPVPAPATLELLQGHATRPEDGQLELVTPTGAAIVAALAEPSAVPALRTIAIGYGAGDLDLDDRPNLLRLILAEETETTRPAVLPPINPSVQSDEMMVLEANIDDMNPELFEAAIDALFAAGARDVTLEALTMKRGRPGTCLKVVGAPEDFDRLADTILSETTSIGVRGWPVSRRILSRSQRLVETRFGSISVKVVTLPAGGTRLTPEYTDCLRAAREHGVSVQQVQDAARAAATAGEPC